VIRVPKGTVPAPPEVLRMLLVAWSLSPRWSCSHWSCVARVPTRVSALRRGSRAVKVYRVSLDHTASLPSSHSVWNLGDP
jgi:hypothetical protein